MESKLTTQTRHKLPAASHHWGYIGLLALWAYAIVKPAVSVGWQYYHDTPLLNFAGVMMQDFGKVPYRDFFETTMPGTFLFHYIIVGLGLEGQTSFVLLGLFAMLILAGLGSIILLALDKRAALLFAPFFLIAILQFGPAALFQREILGLLVIASAMVIATREKPKSHLINQCLVGLCFGVACTIKPQFAVGAPVLVLCLAALTLERERPQSVVRTFVTGIAASLAGFALPLLAALIWLWSYGALERFIFILTEYTPLYIQQTQTHAFTTSELRTEYLWRLWNKFAGFNKYLPAILVLPLLILAYRPKIERRRQIILQAITAMAIVYGLLPIMSGQFWSYHYFPFLFFAIMATSALLAVALEPFVTKGPKAACLMLVTAMLGLTFVPVVDQDRLRDGSRARIEVVKDMENALTKWVPEGRRVQPIDWTAGALHAMMRTRTPIATQFFYDFHFAHHVSTDINAQLRAEFMSALTTAPPEAFLVAHNRSKVNGLDVSYEFPELEAFRNEGYVLVEKNPEFDVYLREDIQP